MIFSTYNSYIVKSIEEARDGIFIIPSHQPGQQIMMAEHGQLEASSIQSDHMDILMEELDYICKNQNEGNYQTRYDALNLRLLNASLKD